MAWLGLPNIHAQKVVHRLLNPSFFSQFMTKHRIAHIATTGQDREYGGGLKNKSKLVLKFSAILISLISWQSNCCLYPFNFVLESSIFHHHSDTKNPFSGPAVKPQTIIRARLMSVEAKAERCTETSLQYCCMPSIRAYSKPSKFCVRETHTQTTKFQTIFTFLLQISDEKNKQ